MRMLLQKNRAFTLVELLIVIAIATILATLSLTTMQGLLKDQKISQSVRLARQYIESARTRAMATGRPVALFLERVSPEGDTTGAPVVANHTVTRMSIGEVFPPYTGEQPLVDCHIVGHAAKCCFDYAGCNRWICRSSDDSCLSK